MPEQIAYVILGAFISSCVVFIFSYFKSRGEIRPHKSPCESLSRLQQDHYALARRVEEDSVRENGQWLRIENLIGGFTSTIEQLVKRIGKMEEQVLDLIEKTAKQKEGG